MGFKIENIKLPYENDWEDDCTITVNGNSISDTIMLTDVSGDCITMYVDQLHSLFLLARDKGII